MVKLLQSSKYTTIPEFLRLICTGSCRILSINFIFRVTGFKTGLGFRVCFNLEP